MGHNREFKSAGRFMGRDEPHPKGDADIKFHGKESPYQPLGADEPDKFELSEVTSHETLQNLNAFLNTLESVLDANDTAQTVKDIVLRIYAGMSSLLLLIDKDAKILSRDVRAQIQEKILSIEKDLEETDLKYSSKSDEAAGIYFLREQLDDFKTKFSNV